MAHPFVKLKGCGKCGGDVALQTDLFGQYLGCLQCGTHYEMPRRAKGVR